jgi:hypothetical protein
MTRYKTLQCVHEPFGDAYYFGPERLAERYESDPEARKESGYSDSTYRTIFDRIAKENSEVSTFVPGFRTFISHAFQYLLPDRRKRGPMVYYRFYRHFPRSSRFVSCVSYIATLHLTFVCGVIAQASSTFI